MALFVRNNKADLFYALQVIVSIEKNRGCFCMAMRVHTRFPQASAQISGYDGERRADVPQGGCAALAGELRSAALLYPHGNI
jgi:hypothetical protein